MTHHHLDPIRTTFRFQSTFNVPYVIFSNLAVDVRPSTDARSKPQCALFPNTSFSSEFRPVLRFWTTLGDIAIVIISARGKSENRLGPRLARRGSTNARIDMTCALARSFGRRVQERDLGDGGNLKMRNGSH
jgi:hypothetical protein